MLSNNMKESYLSQVHWLIIPLVKALSHHCTNDKQTSNGCHRFNFNCRYLKFSDIVSKRIMVPNLYFKISNIYKKTRCCP